MKLTGTVVRLAAVVSVQLLFTAVIVVVFGQVRFDRTNSYSAEFSNASGLRAGQFVRASGVEVGKVKKVDLVEGDKRIRVDFSVDRSVQLYQSTTAQIRYPDLIGNRYLEISRGTGEGAERALPPGGFIPLSRTQPALDLDALIGGFKPLFRALDPQKVNTIASSIITVFQGEGGTINDILDQTAQLTERLAESDQAIGEVITNLNTVLDTTVRHRKQFDQTIDKFELLITGLKDRAAHSLTAPRTSAMRPERWPTCWPTTGPCCTTRSAAWRPSPAPLVEQRDQLGDLLGKLPTAFNIIGRASGIYGDFFNFYLCDLSIKVNGLQPGGPFARSSSSSSRRVGARCNENAAARQPGACRCVGHRDRGPRCRCGTELQQSAGAVRDRELLRPVQRLRRSEQRRQGAHRRHGRRRGARPRDRRRSRR